MNSLQKMWVAGIVDLILWSLVIWVFFVGDC
jgi:hypothetical protein